MFRCTECRQGNIHASYGKGRDPVYRCTHCKQRHEPRKRAIPYRPIWAMQTALAAAAESISLPVEGLAVSMAEASEAFERLGRAANKVANADMDMALMSRIGWWYRVKCWLWAFVTGGRQ